MEGDEVDVDLEALKAKRLGEMQAQSKEKAESGNVKREREEAAAKEKEMREAILSQILDQDARSRLSTIAAAKPDKARQVENMIINMARFGQIGGKLTDQQFRDLLDKVSEQSQRQTTVKFDRRRAAIDSDSD